jgi:fusion and transport protein UGO1
MFSTLRTLPSYFCPSILLLPTVLHSLIHPVLTLSTPLVLRTRSMIDRDVSPMTFSIAKFCASSVALFVKLPLETVLRRGQVAVLASDPYVHALDGAATRGRRLGGDKLETVVPTGRFDGLVGTMHTIVTQEGSRPVPSRGLAGKGGRAATATKGKTRVAETVYRQGQGLEGLWRGWKVSWWGIVGLWTAGVIGGGGDGEF